MDTVPDRDYLDAVDAQREQFRTAKANPVAFFARRENWPKMLHEELASHTTFFYGNRAHRHTAEHNRQPGDWSVLNYARLWPLPVGRAALRKRVREIRERGTEGFHGDPSALADTLPFDGMELAGWILDARVGVARVEAFGLVRIEDLGPDPKDLTIDEMVFRLTGSSVTSHDVRALCDDVAKWWDSLGGKRVVRMGRPLGSGYFATAHEFHQAHRDSLAALKRDNIRPTPVLIADRLSIAERTYYDYKSRYGLGE